MERDREEPAGAIDLLKKCSEIKTAEDYRALWSELEGLPAAAGDLGELEDEALGLELLRTAIHGPTAGREILLRAFASPRWGVPEAAGFHMAGRSGEDPGLARSLLAGRDAWTEPVLDRMARSIAVEMLSLSRDRRLLPLFRELFEEHYHFHPPGSTAQMLAALGEPPGPEFPLKRSLTILRSGSQILIHDDERFAGSSNCIDCRFFPCRLNHAFRWAIEDCKLWNRTDPKTLFEVIDYRQGPREGREALRLEAAAPLEELVARAEALAEAGSLREAAEVLREAVLATSDLPRKVGLVTRAARLLIRAKDLQRAFGLLRGVEDKARDLHPYSNEAWEWDAVVLALTEELGGAVEEGAKSARSPGGRILAGFLARLRRGPGTDRREAEAVVSHLERLLETAPWDSYRWLSHILSFCSALGRPEKAAAVLEPFLAATSAGEGEALEHEILAARRDGALGEREGSCARLLALLPRVRTVPDGSRRLEYLGYALEALAALRPAPRLEQVRDLAAEARDSFGDLLAGQPGSATRRRLREDHQRTMESALAALRAVAGAAAPGSADEQRALAEAWRTLQAARNPELRAPALALGEDQARRLRSLEDSLHRGLHHCLCGTSGPEMWQEMVLDALDKVTELELSAVERRQPPGSVSLEPPGDGLAMAFFQFRELFPEGPVWTLTCREGIFASHWVKEAESRVLVPLQTWWAIRHGTGARRQGSVLRAGDRAAPQASHTAEEIERLRAIPGNSVIRSLAAALLPPGLTGAEAERWHLFPDGRLHSLPLELLPDPAAAGPLGARVAPRFCLRPAPPPAGAGPLALSRGWLGLGGVPAVPHFPALPGTGEEVEAVARDLRTAGIPSVRVLTGEEAHAENLLALLREETPAVLHIAAHGHADRDLPDACAVILAAEPGGAAVELLPFRLIRDLPLQGVELVVLSACSSSVGRSTTGAGMEGLAWTFLDTGAAQVLASRYPVKDGETRDLMRILYRHLLVLPVPEALRATRVEALAQGFSAKEVGAWALWC